MQVTIRNLGRIENATIDWRPLTVFVGPNNTNKTWTAYGLYTFAKILCAYSDTPRVLPKQLQASVNQLVKRVEKVLAEKPADAAFEYSFPAIERSQITLESPSAGPQFRIDGGRYAEILHVDTQLVRNADVLLATEAGTATSLLYETLHLSVAQRTNDDLIEIDSVLQANGARSAQSGTIVGRNESQRVSRYIAERVADLWMAQFESAFVMPAERKALLSMYSLFATEIRESLPEPIVDFTNLVQKFRHRGEFGRTRHSESKNYELKTEFEAILGGHVRYSPEDYGFRFFFGEGSKVPLHGASSLARSLAGLELLADQGPIRNSCIVIDEPEMNAHPEAQCQIAELLAMIVNAGNHVVITTHSPYFIEHINNLVEAGKLPTEKRGQIHESFFLRRPEAFLDPEKVSVHHFDTNGQVTDLFDREENIIDGATFGTISERLESLYLKIIRQSD